MFGSVFRRTLPIFGAAAVVASLALAGGVASGAAASSAHAAVKAPHFVYGTYAISTWGGYATTGTDGQFTSVTASWKEPKVTCVDDNSLYAPWVGIDGFRNDTVEQTGVQTYCGTGKPVDSAWYEMYPASPVYYSNPVKAGDSIVAKVTSSGSNFTLTIQDITRDWTETTQSSTDGAENMTAEAVIESPSTDYPNIPSVSFTGVKFDGKALDTYSLTKLTTDSGAGTTKYKPSAITGTDDFTMLPHG
jgi:hypothetical protein